LKGSNLINDLTPENRDNTVIKTKLFMICPVRMDERQRWRKVLRYDGDESSRWDERCLQACYHSNAQVSNGNEKDSVESIVKSESYLEGEAISPLYRCAL